METSVSISPTNSLALTSPSPTFAPTETPLPQSSLFVQLKYPNHENCTIQVNTQKWEITEEGKKSIASTSRVVPISNKPGVYGIVFIKHKNYIDCQMKWIPDRYIGGDFQKPLETINGKTWEVWHIEMAQGKVYFWPELREIQFVQQWPLYIPQKESCQADIYEILGSLECK
jgi:hypothetical protein